MNISRWAGLPFIALLALLQFSVVAIAENVMEPEGYRTDRYRGPIPLTLEGAKVVNTETAHTLWKSKRVAFIDVLPQAPKPKKLPKGTIWRNKVRQSIPGAVWLPNVGYGRIADVSHTYFKQSLIEVTKNNLHHPVLFFCLDECWMSWNAAKRAIEYGYTHVFWYPEGTFGWTFQNYPTQEVKPKAGF